MENVRRATSSFSRPAALYCQKRIVPLESGSFLTQVIGYPPLTPPFMIRKIVFAIAALVCASTLVSAREEQSPTQKPQGAKRPNVIFILTDDQGYGDISRHGHPLLRTPNFDRIHDESVRFDNFYVSPSCSPTRAALLTGIHEFQNGVTHTRHPREQLYSGATTLPQLLKASGYRTGLIGKWHLGEEYTPEHGGFDTYFQSHGDHYSGLLTRNGKKSRVTPGRFREDCYFDEAMNYIDECGDQPFFLEIATISPHAPLVAPEEFVAPFRGKVSEEEALYLGMVQNLDFNIGRLLEFLEKRNLNKNTILVAMNDNGATHGLDIYNAGMRGCKTTPWQGGSRAFSFWRWPEHWKPHTVDNLTAHLDFLPTICQLTGTHVPEALQKQLDGFSLVPLLENVDPTSWHDDRMLFVHAGRWPSGMAAGHKYYKASVFQKHMLLVRSRGCDDPHCNGEVDTECDHSVEKGGKTLIYTKENAQYHWGITPKGRWSLFDLKKDPASVVDIADQHPELVKSMAAAYDLWWDEIYPMMISNGGDAELVEVAKKRAEAAAKKAAAPSKE